MFVRPALTLLLREADVRALLPVPVAMDLLEAAFQCHGRGEAVNRARARLQYGGGMLQAMTAALPEQRAAGGKTYLSTRTGTRFLVWLWDSNSGELLALLEADWLGRIRTGAASGVATRLLARSDAGSAGVIGAGGQAQTQVEALLAARPLSEVKIFSRRPETRTALAHRLSSTTEAEVRAVSSAREAVENSDIVTTITTAGEPVFDGAWLAPGTHVNAAGSNGATRRELDDLTMRRAAVVAVDALDQAHLESGDILGAVAGGALSWDDVVELSSVITGNAAGRSSADQITVFESLGIALEDVAVARYVYDRALETGRGQRVEFGAPVS